MMDFEYKELMQLVAEYFPKTAQSEFRLLRKVVGGMPFKDAKELIEQAKLDTKYLTLPIQAINKAVKGHRQPRLGEYHPCWALKIDGDGSKWEECMVLAQSNDGAKVEFAKYLAYNKLDATDYMLYIGQESFDAFFNERHEQAVKANPKIAENVAFLESLVRGDPKRLIDVMSGNVKAFDIDDDDGIPF
jgi:hypothetical protein